MEPVEREPGTQNEASIAIDIVVEYFIFDNAKQQACRNASL